MEKHFSILSIKNRYDLSITNSPEKVIDNKKKSIKWKKLSIIIVSYRYEEKIDKMEKIIDNNKPIIYLIYLGTKNRLKHAWSTVLVGV